MRCLVLQPAVSHFNWALAHFGYRRWVPAFDLATARLVPFTGTGGWVWRSGHAAGYVNGASEWGVVGLLAACEGASSAEEVVGRVVAALSGDTDEPWPAFSLVTAAAAGGVTVLVHGAGEVVVERDGGERVRVIAEGRWSARVVSSVRLVRLGSGYGDASALADLRLGVLPSLGAVILGADVIEDEPPLAELPVPEPLGVEPLGVEPLDVEPLGVEPAARSAFDETTIAPAQAPTVSAERRGPLAALTWDSGDTDFISRDTIVGRDPGPDPSVQSEQAVALVPKGKSEGMSRVHAELRVVGSEILLSDRGSTNGTFVWDEDRQSWHRLEAGERCPLRVGSIIAFGERTATVDPPEGG